MLLCSQAAVIDCVKTRDCVLSVCRHSVHASPYAVYSEHAWQDVRSIVLIAVLSAYNGSDQESTPH